MRINPRSRWWWSVTVVAMAALQLRPTHAAAAKPLTMADIEDSLLSPTSEQYVLYILPHSEDHNDVHKRQALYQSNEDDDQDEPLPEPEPTKKHYDSGNDSKESAVRNNTADGSPSNPRKISDPLSLPSYDSEELHDKMESYAIIQKKDPSGRQHPMSNPRPTHSPVPTPTTSSVASLAASPITWGEPEETDYTFGTNHEKMTNSKKLLTMPKKTMKVIKLSSEGEFVPQEVPGVMMPTEDGSEEAFVPADLLEDTEILLTEASAQQPSFLPPQQAPYQSPAQPKGMPYRFGYIVDDEATANFQTRQEQGDEQGVVTGCYQVLEPTGLVRTVTYQADEGGFRVLSLTQGPDKTPCPGLEDATSAPAPYVPTDRPQYQPTPQPYPQPPHSPTHNPAHSLTHNPHLPHLFNLVALATKMRSVVLVPHPLPPRAAAPAALVRPITVALM